MTNESKFTPGPWKIMQCAPRVPQYEGQTETVIVDENNRNVLNRDVCEEAANARLIAAAPDLLEACKAIIVAVKTWDSKGGELRKLLSRANPLCVEAVESAIAKTEGFISPALLLPLAVASVAVYAVAFMASHGVFQALSMFGGR